MKYWDSDGLEGIETAEGMGEAAAPSWWQSLLTTGAETYKTIKQAQVSAKAPAPVQVGMAPPAGGFGLSPVVMVGLAALAVGAVVMMTRKRGK